MNIKLIPYIVVVLFLGIIISMQYKSQNRIVELNKSLADVQKQFTDYQLKQKEMQLNIINEINESNNKRMSELNESIAKINTITNNNRAIINELRSITSTAETNYDSFSEATRKHYTETLRKLFNESTEILVEIAERADRSTEAAIIYHTQLVDQYEIVKKHNESAQEK